MRKGGMCGALLILVRLLTALIDSGRLDAVSVQDIRQHIRNGDLLRWLNSLDQRFDVSLFGVSGCYVLEAREWEEGLDRQLNAMSPEDYGTERRGLCFLFAMTVEQLSFEIERTFDLYEKRLAQVEQSGGSGSPPPRQH